MFRTSCDMSGWRGTVCAGILLGAVTFPSSAWAAPHKLDHALETLARGQASGAVQVIITGDRDAVRRRLTFRHHDVVVEQPMLDAITSVVDVAELRELEKDPAVRSVSIDAPVYAHATALTGPDALITLDQVRAIPGANATGLTGRGVGVAIIDSGFQNCPDLHTAVRAFYDFTAQGKAVAPFDDFGHGTHIAATIGSSGQQQQGAVWRGL